MKTAVITGADRGLGLSLCREFLKMGYTVIGGRFMPAWTEIDELKKEWSETFYPVFLDISQTESVKQAAKETALIIDHVDVLVNCAGIDGHMRSIREGQDYEAILKVFNVDALGAVRMIEAFLPLLDLGEEKKICTISSEAGSIGTCWRDNELEYCMAKAALNMAMAQIHNALKKDGYDIRVYHPGWMKTYMLGYKSEEADLEADDAAKLAVKSFFREKNREELTLDSYDGSVIAW